MLLDAPKTQKVIEPDEQDIFTHFNPGEDWCDFAAVNFLPVHCHLVHFDTQLLRNQKNFNIERPSLNMQIVENHLHQVHLYLLSNKSLDFAKLKINYRTISILAFI